MDDVVFVTNEYTYRMKYIYEEYNGPLFFLCCDQFNSNYLASASICDENKETFILVKITLERLKKVLSNDITLFDLYRKAETDFVILITHHFDSSMCEQELISAAEIPDLYLPEQGYYLDISEDSLRYDITNSSQNSEKQLCEPNHFTRIELILFPSISNMKYAMEVSKTANFLKSINELRESTMIIKSNSNDGRITNTIRRKAPFVLSNMRKGSIVFVLESEDLSLDENASASELFALLSIDDENELMIQLSKYNQAIVNRYRSFLNDALSTESDMEIRLYKPLYKNYNSINIERSKLAKRKQYLDKIDEQIVYLDMKGKLFGYDQNRRIFSFLLEKEKDDEEIDVIISGKVDNEYLDTHLNTEMWVNKSGQIYLKKITKYDTYSCSVKDKYIMTDFIFSAD